ncbi:hypothetical protein G7077_09520 [Sphingomonas piscis]|uniref:Uncharacterized protein n=1 Tax=Sphingomonas piscis TaxID=2714943 RepID=A0A6G7YQT6_9SPHN|nr:hypothetical protein [Sphingomonas piscis]QIK79099.1 hypothetical protein G7077_09520 [Sphingomonas piscis]
MLLELAFALSASFATAETPVKGPPVNDVRCLVLSYTFGLKANNEAAKKVAQSAAIFYLGRIDGRFTSTQLRAAVARERRLITPQSAGSLMQECAGKMQASAQILKSISR